MGITLICPDGRRIKSSPREDLGQIIKRVGLPRRQFGFGVEQTLKLRDWVANGGTDHRPYHHEAFIEAIWLFSGPRDCYGFSLAQVAKIIGIDEDRLSFLICVALPLSLSKKIFLERYYGA